MEDLTKLHDAILVGNFKEGPDTYRVIASAPMLCRFDRSRPRDAQITEWAQAFADQLERMLRRYHIETPSGLMFPPAAMPSPP